MCARVFGAAEVPRTPGVPRRPPSRTPSATWSLLGATWPSKPHSKRNLAPPSCTPSTTWSLLGATWIQLALPSRTPSATWHLLGSTWLSKPHSKCHSAPLESILGGLGTVKIELPCRRELHLFFLQSCHSKLLFGLSFRALGLDLELTGSIWSSAARLGAPWLDLLCGSWNPAVLGSGGHFFQTNGNRPRGTVSGLSLYFSRAVIISIIILYYLYYYYHHHHYYY